MRVISVRARHVATLAVSLVAGQHMSHTDGGAEMCWVGEVGGWRGGWGGPSHLTDGHVRDTHPSFESAELHRSTLRVDCASDAHLASPRRLLSINFDTKFLVWAKTVATLHGNVKNAMKFFT